MYLARFSYAPDAVKSLIENPQDRSGPVGASIESLGGKMHGMWYSFGDWDGYVLSEFPDDQAAAAFSMVTGASGSLAKLETIPLMSTADAVGAFERAADATYATPGS
jgi:uncharacterized protein with GYD domain